MEQMVLGWIYLFAYICFVVEDPIIRGWGLKFYLPV
jgi:hypothetical protein